MKATIQIQMDNAAFDDEPATELARILRKLAEKIEQGSDRENLRDHNGNRVGEFLIEK